MMSELKDLLQDKGGDKPVFTTYAVEIGCQLWDLIYNFLVDTYPNTELEVLQHGLYSHVNSPGKA